MRQEQKIMLLLKLGFIGIIIQAVGVIVAVFKYNNYNYNWNLSSLGARATDYSIVTGQRIPKATYPEIFNATIVVSALFMLSIPVVTYIVYTQRVKGDKYSLWLVFQVGFSFTAFLALIVLGVYDVGSSYPLHYIATLIFFAFMIIALLFNWLWNLIYRERIYRNWDYIREIYYLQIIILFFYLVFSALGIFSLYNIFTQYYFINNGIFQKVWGTLYLVIWLIHLYLINLDNK